MNAEIEAMMAANKAAMEESKEEADISQEEMASRLGKKYNPVGMNTILTIIL